MAQRMTFWKKVARMSPCYEAKAVPLPSPKSPLAGLHNPEAEQQVGECVGHHARSQASASVGDQIVKRPAEECGDPIRSGMGKAEGQRNDEERDPGERSYPYRRELFGDQVTQHKPAPENFLHQRRHDHEPEEAQKDRGPVQR